MVRKNIFFVDLLFKNTAKRYFLLWRDWEGKIRDLPKYFTVKSYNDKSFAVLGYIVRRIDYIKENVIPQFF